VQPAITIDRLEKRYGELTAVDGVSLEVARGETYALLGPNGAGKTTTVEILEGLRRATGGSVSVLGLDPIVNREDLQPAIGVMLQEGGAYPGARAKELLTLLAAFFDNPRSPDELLSLVGLTEQSRTLYRRLSGGEKQRLSLAMALVGRPELVFLDEPTAGLDPGGRRATWQTIERLKDDGVTILLTTHFMDEAEYLADRVGIIHRGRLVAEGPPADLVHGTGGLSFLAPSGLPVDQLTERLGAPVREASPGRYVAELADPNPAQIAALTTWLAEHNILLRELRLGAAGLEEIFLALTEEESS
jgi:ABC-2 type transport system ATP-binding protein